jgi:hypothetical protein
MKKTILIVFALLLISVRSYAYDYYYYLGSFVEREEFGETVLTPPDGVVGMVDLTPPNGGGNSIVFFASTKEIDGVLLVRGDISKTKVGEDVKTTWFKLTGYKPAGETLLDLLWDYLTVGSDPEGITTVKPLMPTSELILELHLGGHSIVKSEKFDIKKSSHKEKVIAVLQKEYSDFKEDCDRKGSNKNLELLDFFGDKYKINNPEDVFIPKHLPKEKPMKHHTTFTEDWNCGDSASLNCDLTWSELQGTSFGISSNAATNTSVNAVASAQMTSPVSSSDNYSQVDILIGSVTSLGIATTRMGSGSMSNYYALRRYNDGAVRFRIEKAVAGTLTAITTAINLGASYPETWKIEANGSTISCYLGGVLKDSVTDTGVSSGLYGGIRHYKSTTQANSFDNFVFSDIGSSSLMQILNTGIF